ncbi:MAG: 2-succinylbenzoate--CoA ligase [Thainema sp.]
MDWASYLEGCWLKNWWINGDLDALQRLIEAKWRELDQVKSRNAQPVVLLAEAEPVRFLAGLLAAGSRDCVLVLANPGWRDREWQQVAQLIKPDIIWSDTPLSIFQSPIIHHSLLTNSPSTLPRNAILIPTGGSSGDIKFAIHTWDTLTASMRGFQQHFQVDAVSCYCTLPLYHVSGLMQVLRSLISGGQLIIQPFRELQQGQRITLFETADSNWFLSLVPTQLQRLLLTQNSKLKAQNSSTHPPIHPSTPSLLTPHSSPHSPLPLLPWLATLKAILLGGGAAWPQLFSQARQLGLPLAPTYGMTETASQVATLQPQDFLAGNESCGRVLPHAEIAIHDETGAILPPGQPGQIRIQAQSLALGYLSLQPTTNFLPITHPPIHPSTLPPIHSFQPDDQGYLDADGNLHIVGRNSTKIITGGENVFPEEVEAVIRATGLVADVCVVGVPDAEWGQAVTAIWVPGVDTDRERIEQKLRSAIATQLSKYKHPKCWLMVEQLPRNAQGKIVRSQLPLSNLV